MRFVPLAVVALLFLLALPSYSASVQPDSALKKPVTLAAKGEALVDIVKEMRRQTGLRLSVSKDIADQKATVFVDDKPVGEVMNGLATIFRFQWNRRKYDEKTFSWVLVMSAEERKFRDRLQDQGMAEAKSSVEKWIASIKMCADAGNESREAREKEVRKEIDRISALPKPSEEDKAKLDELSREESVLLDLDRMPEKGLSAKLYSALPCNAINALWDGLDVYVDSESAEPEWKVSDADFRSFVGWLRKHDEEMRSLSMQQGDGSVQPPSHQIPDALNIKFRLLKEHGYLCIDVQNETRGRSPEFPLPYRMTGTEYPLGSERLESAAVCKADLPKLPDLDRKDLIDAKVSYSKKDVRDEAGADGQPKDEASVVANVTDTLALLHKKAGLQVISDHYSWWSSASDAKDMSEADIIKDRIEQAPFRRSITGWDGKYLYVRACEYPGLDEKEIPNYLLDAWRSAIAANRGMPGLEEYADIAALSRSKLDRFIECRDYLGLGCVETSPLHDAALRLYGLLSRSQRRQAWGDGAQVSGFSDEQSAQLMCENMSIMRYIPKLDRVGVYLNGVRVDKHDDSPYPVVVKMKDDGMAAIGVPLSIDAYGNIIEPEKDGIGASWELFSLTVELSDNENCHRTIQIPAKLEKIGS